MSIGGWSIFGIASAVLIVAGIALLVVYAAQRGLVHRDLDGTLPEGAPADTLTAPRAPARGRTLGMVGAAALVAGLVLGLLAAITGWGNTSPVGGTGPGTGPVDCAASYAGCPQATPGP